MTSSGETLLVGGSSPQKLPEQNVFVRPRAVSVLKRNWVALVLVVISLLYGGTVTMMHDETVSPIDELVYIDYTYKTLSQGLVFEGEQFGDEVTYIAACEGVFPFGTLGLTCDPQELDLELMPNQGFTTGAPYTPVYFWITRIVGDAIQFVTGLGDVTSWRLTGPLWLAGSLLLFSALMRRWRVSNSTTLTLGLLFIASPFTWWTYTYLSTDVSAVLFGTAMLLVATQVARGEWSPWWFVPMAFGAALFKITNLLAFGWVLIFFIIRALVLAWQDRRRSLAPPPHRGNPLSLWGALLVSVVIGVAIQLGWTKLVPLLAVSDVRVDQGISVQFGLDSLLSLLVRGPATAIAHNPAGGVMGGNLGLAFAPLNWVFIAFLVGAVMALRWQSERGPVVWATALASVVALPVLAIAFVFTTNSYFELPGRYAASLIPMILLCGAFLLKNRLAKVLLIVYSGGLMSIGLYLALYIQGLF